MRTMSQPWARAIVALVLVVSLATGCGDDESGDDVAASTSGPASATSGDSTASTPSGEAGKEAQKLTVTATDFAFEGIPDEITAGAVSVTFTNDGSVLHDLGFVQVAEDTTLAQFDKDFPPVVEGGPFPDYAEAVVVPVQAEPGASAEADFPAHPRPLRRPVRSQRRPRSARPRGWITGRGNGPQLPRHGQDSDGGGWRRQR